MCEEELQFVKLKLPRLIPLELIESVKGKTFTAEQFYKDQEAQIHNPYNHLYAMVDKKKKIEGYLWCEVNPIDHSLFINTFSVNKKYWGKGSAIPKAIEFIKSLQEKTKFSRIFWITTNEKFFIKMGFKKSKNVLMEYKCD